MPKCSFRSFLALRLLCLNLLFLATPLQAADWNKPAFEANTLSRARAALQMNTANESPELHINALDDAENGALVPVEIVSQAANTQALAIFVEKNNFPLSAYFEFANGALPEVSLRLKLAETSAIHALARGNQGGKPLLHSQKEIRINLSGCGPSGEAPRKPTQVTTPMKIKAVIKNEFAEIRVLMSHPMTPLISGSDVPPHFIRQFSILLNGKSIVEAQTGFSIARNPVFGFKVRGAKAGDKVSITWQDSRGDTRTDEALIQ